MVVDNRMSQIALLSTTNILFIIFLPFDIFFDILLIFASFLQTYYDICFFHILSFSFYLLEISFYIYFLLALLVFLYHFYDNILLYLVLFLCSFDNKFSYSFSCIKKKNYKIPFLSIKLELFINLFASRLLIYKK